MSTTEYVLSFIGIIVGLAVADLAHSLHRLLRASGQIRWHWYPLATTSLLLLLILEIWWGMAYLGRPEVRLTIGTFLPLVAGLVVLYLAASAALPDAVPDEGLDLRDYYFHHHRYFWLLFALLVGIFLLQRAGFAWWIRGAEILPRVFTNVIPNFAIIGIAISLAYVRRAWWHSLWLLLLPIVMFASTVNRQLVLPG